MWSVGDRVLGQRPDEKYWYPGTIKHNDGTRFFVLFDDGEDALLGPPHLARLQLNAGDRVQARTPAGRSYNPGRVLAAEGDKVHVKFDDGYQEWTSLGLVRLDRQREEGVQDRAAVARAPGGKPARPESWSVGDVVLVCWHDLFWYPAAVLALKGGQVHVVLDDGNQVLTAPDQVRPFAVEVGDRVQGRWKAGPQYYPGEVTYKSGNVVHVKYDDGDEETTLMRLLRLDRDDWLTGEVPWSEGDRVLASWYDGNWYPGVVLAVNGKRLHVLYDDGDQALLGPNRVKRLDFQVGDRVCCRWKGGPVYYPGEITRKKGEIIHINYDDGDEETTSIRLVRLEREGARDEED